MQTNKPTSPSNGLATLLAGMCLLVPLQAVEPAGAAALADREQRRRNAAVEEAQELLRKGDEAYQNGRYSDAVEAYAGARDLIPDAPLTSELRQAATDRYAQASVEKARTLSRKGDVAAAKTTVDRVLSEGVAPKDPGALALRSQLDDPIRTNPALTADHAKNVDQVRRLLYTAEGAFNLGKFDEATAHYQEVLRIDPTNSAARRGMEVVASAKSDYHKSARDHTRAEMLGQTDAAWELQVPAPADLGVGPANPDGGAANPLTVTLATRLDRFIIPVINFDQVGLEEAVDFLRLTSNNPDLADGPINFTVNLGSPDSEISKTIRAKKFDLRLRNIPASQALRYIADLTHTSFATDEFSVIITPVSSASGELITRTYHVPPDFISSLSNGKEAAGGKAADPFSQTPAKDGLLTTRLTAKEALANQGVPFPEGSNAIYSPSNNTLTIVNTAAGQDMISQLVETLNDTEPVLVSVQVTMIKTQKTNLDELGFDTLVTPFNLNRSNTLFGSGGTAGNSRGRTGGDFINPINGTSISGIPADSSAVASGVLTNGLRSGDSATTTSSSIDGLVNNPDRSSQAAAAAPGILSITGLFNDGQVQTIMRGLNQKKNVDLMAKPSTVTRSNQASTITLVREFIYPTEYEPPQLPNSVGVGGGSPVTPAHPTAFQKKDLGVTLEVLPVVDSSKRYVDITLNPVISDLDGFVNYGSPINATTTSPIGITSTVEITKNAILMPIFSVNRANTQVTVADGATIAIGGLLASSVQNVEDKVPLLGDIPVVGRLFTTKTNVPISTALIFLVHIELMDATGRPFRAR